MIFFFSLVSGHALELTRRKIQLAGQTIPHRLSSEEPHGLHNHVYADHDTDSPTREQKKKDTPNELTKPTRNEEDPHSEKVVPLSRSSSRRSQRVEIFHSLCAISLRPAASSRNGVLKEVRSKTR